MNNRIYLLALAATVAVACSKPPSTPTPPTTSPTPAATSASGTPPPAPPKEASTPPAPAEPVVQDTLKNDAYAYYGLADQTAQKQIIKCTGQTKGTFNGTHSVKLVSASGDQATFKETQTGTPQGDLDQTISLTKDGIFIESTEPETLKTPHVLQLPSDLKAGGSWNYDMDLAVGEKSLKLKCVGKVVGDQPVKTKGGNMTALYVTSHGEGTFDSAKAELDEEWWYVKDKGLVKSKETLSFGSKKQIIESEIAG